MSTTAQSLLRSDLLQPWKRPWPLNETEILSVCPVCSSPERRLLHQDLVDNVFYCAPGKWTSWRCCGCGVAYIDPRPSSASIALAYEDYYTHDDPSLPKRDYQALGPFQKIRRRLVNGYTRWRFGNCEAPASLFGILAILAAWPLRVRLDGEYRHLPRPPKNGGTLLDIGCGDGSFLRTALGCGWEVTGVDIDAKALEKAKTPGVTVLQGGIELFGGQEGLFDVITLNHVIEHVHDPVSLLAGCHRLLRNGGQLWLQTPNVDSLGHLNYGRHWRGLEPPRHLVLFDLKSLKMALAQGGFTRIVSKPTPSHVLSISIASEKIKRGLGIETEIKLSVVERWARRRDAFMEALMPSRREFLTVAAFKRRVH